MTTATQQLYTSIVCLCGGMGLKSNSKMILCFTCDDIVNNLRMVYLNCTELACYKC